MNKFYLLFSFILSLGFYTHAQEINMVSTGPGYGHQAYYKLSTGQVTMVKNDAWDIAFSSAGQNDAGVFINESSGTMGGGLELYLAPTLDWSENITDFSSFTEENRLHNPEKSWTEGAFNTNKDTNSPFDYGWGIYNPQSNMVEGHKIFMIKKRDGSFVKFQIVQIRFADYTIRYSNPNGTNEITKVVSKSFTGKKLIHFSLNTGDLVNIPTDYDLVFMRYTRPLEDGGNTLQYNVTGVLLAPGVEAVKATNIDPNTVNEADYKDSYSALPTVIGHEWKTFDFNAGWVMGENEAYFVKTANKDKYKIIFYDFEGSTTGITTLEKTFLGNTSSIINVENSLAVQVFPNPSSEFLVVKYPTSSEVTLMMYDQSGRLVTTIAHVTNNPMIFPQSIENGQYFLQILVDNKTFSSKLTILK